MSDHGQHSPQGERDYQDRDIRLKPILIFGLITAVFTAVTYYAIEHYFNYLGAKEAKLDASLQIVPRQIPPDPTLQVQELADLLILRQGEQAVLHSYGWVNKEAGVVRIPIQKAMSIALEKGFPVRETTTTP